MGPTAEQLASVHDEPTHGGNETTPTPLRANTSTAKEGIFAQFDRDLFFKKISDVNNPESAKPIEITERTKDGYKNFLRDQLHLLQDPEAADLLHEHEREFLSEFAKFSASGEREHVTDAQLEEYLKDPHGWIVATQLLEEQIMIRENALGLYAAANPAGDRENMVREGRIWLNIGRGRINKGWHEKVVPNLGKIARRTGVAAGLASIGTGAAALTGFPLLAGAAGFVAAGAPILQGARQLWDSAFTEGETIDLRRCVSAFEVASQNPTEAAYVKHMTGIDVNDYQINGDLVELRRGNRSFESTRSAQALQSELEMLLKARENWYTSNGVNREDLDATPEQFLHEYNGQGFLNSGVGLDNRMRRQGEQTEATWLHKMQKEFQPNRGGIQSIDNHTHPASYQTVQIENPPGSGNWEDNPDFDPHNLDYYGNLARFMEARRHLIVEEIQEFARKREREETMHKDIELFEERKKNVEKEREDQAREDKETADRYGVDKTTWHGEKEALRKYQQGVEKLQEQRESAEATKRARNEALLTEVVNPRRGAPPYTNATAIRADLYGLLSNSVNKLIIDGIPMQAPQARIDNARAEEQRIKSIVFAGPPDTITAYNTRIKNAEEDTKNEVRQAQEDIKTINEKLKAIQAIETPATAEAALSEEDIQTAKELTTQMRRDYDRIIGFGGITDAQLQDETVEQLMQRVIDAHGWSETQRDDPNRRMQIIRAKAEAQANAIPTHLRASYDYLTRPGGARGWGITDHQLLTLSPQQILGLINTRRDNPAYHNANNVDIQGIKSAQFTAQEQLGHRIFAAINVEIFLDEQQGEHQAAATAVSVEQQKHRYELTIGSMRRQGDHIFPAAANIHRDNISLLNTRELDPHNVSDQRRFKTAEIEEYMDEQAHVHRHIPEGYLNMLDTFFGYKNAEDRSEAFEHALEILPPARMAELLDDHLLIPFGAPRDPRQNLTAVFTDIRNRLTQRVNGRRSLTQENIREAFEAILDTIIQETHAMARH